MSKFIVGKKYSVRSICDHNTVIVVDVAARTAKTLTTAEGQRMSIGTRDDVEYVRPWGNYSMCPVVRAQA